MLIEWDSVKAKTNLRKHKVFFEMAATVFNDPFHLSVLGAKSQAEQRWITIGQAANARKIVVVRTYLDVSSGEVVRFISARKATRMEIKEYEKGI